MSLDELAAIWAAALGVERVRADDDFFDLGGQSAIAVRLLAEIDRRVGLALPAYVLLDHPQLADFHGAVQAALYES